MLWWGLVLSTRPSRSTHEAVRLLSRHTTIINVQCLVTVDEIVALDDCVRASPDHYSHLRIDYLTIEMKNGVKSKTGP